MKLSSHVKPISYLKAHTAQVIREISSQQEPIVITHNGQAKAVIQDINSYEWVQQTLALLKILALGNRQIDEGQIQSTDSAFETIRERRERR